MEFTLALLKPDAFCRPIVVKALYDALAHHSVKICMVREFKMPFDLAEKFYCEHKGKFYYDRLLFNITSGALRAHVFEGIDVIKRWRAIIGPTKVNKLHFEPDDSLRSHFGLSDTRNSFHGSDSMTSALREISLIFPDFSTSNRYPNLLPNLLVEKAGCY